MTDTTANRRVTRPNSNRLARYIKTPKGSVLGLLIVLALTSIIVKHDVKSMDLAIVGAATGFVLDLVVGMFYKKKRFVSDGGIITGLIIGMIVGSFSPLYMVVVATAIAIASKHILKVKRKPIFNPAAVGLLVVYYVFGTEESWWGGLTLLPYAYLVLLVAVGLYISYRVKKLSQVVSYMVSYLVICAVFLLFHGTHMYASFGFQNPLINTALFLAFFMLTDPPTSPGKPRHQIWFGAMAALISAGMYLINPGELAFPFIGLLSANIVKVLQTQWFPSGARHKQKRSERVAIPVK